LTNRDGEKNRFQLEWGVGAVKLIGRVFRRASSKKKEGSWGEEEEGEGLIRSSKKARIDENDLCGPRRKRAQYGRHIR